MEVATLLGMLGLGYAVNTSRAAAPRTTQEGFASSGGSLGAPLVPDAEPPEVQRVRLARGAPSGSSAPGVLSELSGLTGDLTHNNMQPFYRGALKQSLGSTNNVGLLDSYTGTGSTQAQKREQASMFAPQAGVTAVHGLPPISDFLQERTEAPKNRAGQRPVEPVRVGPGLGSGYGSTPTGGFQQFELQEMARPRGVDELRVASNPKLSYGARSGPATAAVKLPGSTETAGALFAHRPARFYENEGGERNFVTTGAVVRETARAAPVMRAVTRPETSQSYTGAAGLAEGGGTYKVPAARAPLAVQHGSWGFRNADATTMADGDTDKAANDYGRSGAYLPPNERTVTGTRTVRHNVAPADSGAVTVPLQDEVRGTRKDEVLGNPREAGNFGGAVGALPVKEAGDVARATQKQTTVERDWLGGATVSTKAAPAGPQDVARATQKQTTVARDWLGGATAGTKAAPAGLQDVVRATQKQTTVERDWLGGAAGGADAAQRHTVVDPDATARTTIRETTSSEYMGGAAPTSDAPARLAVYDPEEIAARATGRSTLPLVDTSRNFADAARARAGTRAPEDALKPTQKAAISARSAYTGSAAGGAADGGAQALPLQDTVRETQKAAISARSAYTGSAGTTGAKGETSRVAAAASRSNGVKEAVVVASARAPAGGGPRLAAGEESMGGVTHRQPASASVNDRAPAPQRPGGTGVPPPTVETVGVVRQRTTTAAASGERFDPAVLAPLRHNPYVMSLSSAAAGSAAAPPLFADRHGALLPPQIAGAPQ